jgi:hypothetical protein
MLRHKPFLMLLYACFLAVFYIIAQFGPSLRPPLSSRNRQFGWKRIFSARAHEGAAAQKIDAERELRRCVLTCLLWEGTF